MTAEPARLPVTPPEGHHPAAPRHLSAGSRRIWHQILADFALEGHHLVILTAALQARDRMEQARLAIERDGLVVEGRFGSRPHPCAAIERDSRLAMLRALRELGLDLEAPASSRPPSRYHA